MVKRSDLTSLDVLQAVAEHGFDAWQKLADRFPVKVVDRAFEREVAAGRLDFGVSLRRCWLEPKGRGLLADADDRRT